MSDDTTDDNEPPREDSEQPREDGEEKSNPPPVTGQFQKGQSGNPGGRPVGAKDKVPRGLKKSAAAMVMAEASRPVSIVENGVKTEIDVFQAAIRQLGVNAAKGKGNAPQKYLEIVRQSEREVEQRTMRMIENTLDYKARWKRRWAEEDAALVPRTVPKGLHPDDIHIDLEKGEVTITGPMTEEEYEELQLWFGHRAAIMERTNEDFASLRRARSAKRIAEIEASIAEHDEELDAVERAIASMMVPRKFSVQ